MEFWSISYKTVLLAYVIAVTSFSGNAVKPWSVLAVLLYLIFNISIYIFKKSVIKQLFTLLSIVSILVCSYGVYPLFILLIPFNFYELSSLYFSRLPAIFVPAFIPLLLMNRSLIVDYAFIAVISFIVYAMLGIFTGRLEKYNDRIETMRGQMQKLTRRLDENAVYIKQSEYTYKLEERNRISQELHDKIGHSMAGALIQMEASKRLMATDKEKASELLQNAIRISQEGLESIRLVLKNIKPPVEQLGINRMKLFMDEFAAKHNLQASFTHGGDVGIITPIQWKIIEENTKEALTNTLKYSNATSVAVDVRVLNTFIRAEVSDNGKGAPKVVKGLGIIGMEERTAAVNGTVIVDGSRGFSVTTLIPCNSE